MDEASKYLLRISRLRNKADYKLGANTSSQFGMTPIFLLFCLEHKRAHSRYCPPSPTAPLCAEL